MPRRRLAALIAALALAAPSTALAQSAGDEQYQDPFGGNGSGQSQGGSGNQGSSSGGAGTTAQAAPAPAPSAAPVATAAQQTAPSAPQLPRTGGNAVLPAVAGFWLLLGGVALRARVRT